MVFNDSNWRVYKTPANAGPRHHEDRQHHRRKKMGVINVEGRATRLVIVMSQTLVYCGNSRTHHYSRTHHHSNIQSSLEQKQMQLLQQQQQLHLQLQELWLRQQQLQQQLLPPMAAEDHSFHLLNLLKK